MKMVLGFDDSPHALAALRWIARQRWPAGTRVKLLAADPREALVDTARSANADLLVVGSHGRTGHSQFLLGSVASHVVAHVPCDVRVVKRTGP